MYLENFSGSASRTGECGTGGTGETSGTGGTGETSGTGGTSETGGTGGAGETSGTGGTGETGETNGTSGRAGASVERVETYFLKLYLIDCEIVERLYTK